MKIPRNELMKRPYIDNLPKDGRVLADQIFFDEDKNDFRLILFNGKKNVEMKTAGYVKGMYWSKKIVDPETDSYFKLLDLMTNNFSFPHPKDEKKLGLIDITYNIEQDIHNFGALIHKQLILWGYIRPIYSSGCKIHISDVYVTEIEYLMGLTRAYFDQLYKILQLLIEQFNPKSPTKLPDTLGSLSDRINAKVFKEKKSQKEVLEAYKLEYPIIDFFENILPLFRLCRNIRNAIYHSGETPEIIFITDYGPGIGMKNIGNILKDPFSDFKHFFEDDENFTKNLLKNDIASLFYFINRIIKFLVESSELFAKAIESSFEKPDNISNDYSMYLRGPEIRYINNLPHYLKKCWIE